MSLELEFFKATTDRGVINWLLDVLMIFVAVLAAIPQVQCLFCQCEVANRASDSAVVTRRATWTENMEVRVVELRRLRPIYTRETSALIPADLLLPGDLR